MGTKELHLDCGLVYGRRSLWFIGETKLAAGESPYAALYTVPMWIAVLWLLPWWLMRRQFLQQPGAHGPKTLTLSEAGASWKWNGGSSDVEWKNYIRYMEGKNQILFYTSPACFNILPKRTIAPEQLIDLRERLKQYIPIAKKRRPVS